MVFVYGTLHKKSLLVWKERFWVLRGTSLSCFKRKGDAEPSRVYALTGQYSIERFGRGSGFHLRTAGKTLRLRAPSDKEEAEWISTLETVIKNEREKITQKPHRAGTKLWWAETKQGQFCFELDDFYEMRKTIGSGGYGIVVSAMDKRTDTKVAIKKVVNAFDDVLVAKRMVREIRLLRQFDHPNIVSIVDILPPVDVNGFNDVYIVLERMDTDLHHIIYSGQHLKEAHMQFFMYQMLCGLKYMHSAQVIHRDLKPANVLVNTTCDLKLCDFGLARSLLNTSAATTQPNDEPVGKMTEYVVTRWWRAPEVFLEAKYNVAIDVWSAGCILAEMLQKKPLFMGNNTAQMLKLIVAFCGRARTAADLAFISNRKARSYILDMPDCAPMELPAKFPGASAGALDLLERMLQFSPNARIAVDDALAHPWLARFHAAEHAIAAAAPALLDAVESAPLTRPALQRLMYEDVCAFRADCVLPEEPASAAANVPAAVAAAAAAPRHVRGSSGQVVNPNLIGAGRTAAASVAAAAQDPVPPILYESNQSEVLPVASVVAAAVAAQAQARAARDSSGGETHVTASSSSGGRRGSSGSCSVDAADAATQRAVGGGGGARQQRRRRRRHGSNVSSASSDASSVATAASTHRARTGGGISASLARAKDTLGAAGGGSSDEEDEHDDDVDEGDDDSTITSA